jgi:endonuclease YncB( thermonuclease family)
VILPDGTNVNHALVKAGYVPMVFGKEVILQTHGRDKSGRILADVLLPDGTHVNHTLVKNGWCWWYRKYAPRNTELARLEKNARETNKGLWVGPTYITPCQWRKRTR